MLLSTVRWKLKRSGKLGLVHERSFTDPAHHTRCGLRLPRAGDERLVGTSPRHSPTDEERRNRCARCYE